MEKDELEEEKLALEKDIQNLQDKAAAAREQLARATEVPVQQGQPIYIVPINHEVQAPSITKPLARYPSSADSWHEKILSGGKFSERGQNEYETLNQG